MNPYILAILGATLWCALMVTLLVMQRRACRACRDRTQERAHREWLLRGWDR